MTTLMWILSFWPYVVTALGLGAATYFVPGAWKVIKELLPYWPYAAILLLVVHILTLYGDLKILGGEKKNAEEAHRIALAAKDETIRECQSAKEAAAKLANDNAAKVDKLTQMNIDAVGQQAEVERQAADLQTQADQATRDIAKASKGTTYACSSAPPVRAAVDWLRNLEPPAAQPAGRSGPRAGR